MWHCNDCGSSFDFPEVKKLDAGMVFCDGIHRPGDVLPECFSTKIHKLDYSQTLE